MSTCHIEQQRVHVSQARWSSVLANLDLNAAMAPVQNGHPGHYNDADGLQVGNVGLSIDEQRSHFTLWALMGSPLLISTDLGAISAESLRVLTAAEIIAVNQDALGLQGARVGPPANASAAGEVWAKRLAGGDLAVVLFNRRGAGPADVALELSTLPVVAATWTARDMWARAEIGVIGPRRYVAKGVPRHGVVALRLTPTNSSGAAPARRSSRILV